MEGFIPTGGAGSTAKVQDGADHGGSSGPFEVTFASAPTVGNMLILAVWVRGDGSSVTTPTGYTLHSDVQSPAFDGGRLRLYSKVAGVAESATLAVTAFSTAKLMYWAEWAGLTSFDDDTELDVQSSGTTLTTGALAPGGSNAVLFYGFVQASRFPTTHTQQLPFAEDVDTAVDASGPKASFGHLIASPVSGSYTAQVNSSRSNGYGSVLAAFDAAGGGITWVSAPDTVDDDLGSFDDVDAVAVANTSGAFWRGDIGSVMDVGRIVARLGFEDAGDTDIFVQGGDESDWSDATTIVTVTVDAAGSLGADDIDISWDPTAHRYWRLVLDGAAQEVRVYEIAFEEESVPVLPPAGKAILEIYVHDEDASRWGTATWATGPATGTEGIWSAAGWTDITPEGVNVHWIWGSRRPSRGILHEQDGASVNIQTYDPDRVLDPGNPDSPYYPQLVPNLPVRVSHDTTVIRTGLLEEISWSARNPFYQGQMLGTDTIGPLHRAGVPADSILGDTLMERIQDAINASGIAVGGIPLPPGGPSGPTLSEYVEGAATDDDISVWEIIRKACQEVLWVPYIAADASLGLRPWGEPLDRGREITATNLEDNKHTINEDGTYSVVSVQVADPDLDPIIRVAAPLPRYGRRMYERRETTIDPEGWAAAVLQDRAWPGVQYIPGAIHCFTAADVDYFGSLETMERVTITVPGVVTVQGRILGGELWVEHTKDSTRGATWIFLFSVATDGSTAIGLNTLVSSQSGEPLVDSMTETDYLEES